VRRMKSGEIVVECGREHLDGFRRYAELADAIAKWLEGASRWSWGVTYNHRRSANVATIKRGD
jgi:hypothetical protein